SVADISPPVSEADDIVESDVEETAVSDENSGLASYGGLILLVTAVILLGIILFVMLRRAM
ncbi:hypothetical protein MNBD_CHLOROFLEXI01-5163, partial [hydrothermal vent metagenome]